MTVRKHRFFPVIHVKAPDQAITNTRIALESGADGVFLINHTIPVLQLLICYRVVRSAFPDAWIGLNWLRDEPADTLEFMQGGMDALWVDNAGTPACAGTSAPRAARFLDQRRIWEERWGNASFTYFGGVAFKYQEAVDDVAAAACAALPFVDVVTTSGDATGVAPTLEKIKTMKEAIGMRDLALGSGVSVGNVRDFMPYVHDFLVRSSISRSPTELDEHLTRQLAELIHMPL